MSVVIGLRQRIWGAVSRARAAESSAPGLVARHLRWVLASGAWAFLSHVRSPQTLSEQRACSALAGYRVGAELCSGGAVVARGPQTVGAVPVAPGLALPTFLLCLQYNGVCDVCDAVAE